MENKENWQFERSSGYAGYRNKVTGEWIYEEDYIKLFQPKEEEPEQTDWKDSTKLLMEAYGDNPKDFPYEEFNQEELINDVNFQPCVFEVIKTDEDAKIFIETMENIPEPNDKLKQAFEDFNKQETFKLKRNNMQLTHKTFDITYTPGEKVIIYEQLFWFNISISGYFHNADSLVEARKLKSMLERKEEKDLIKREGNFFLCITFLFLLINFFIFAE